MMGFIQKGLKIPVFKPGETKKKFLGLEAKYSPHIYFMSH